VKYSINFRHRYRLHLEITPKSERERERGRGLGKMEIGLPALVSFVVGKLVAGRGHAIPRFLQKFLVS
jgi:hypothetical protein